MQYSITLHIVSYVFKAFRVYFLLEDGVVLKKTDIISPEKGCVCVGGGFTSSLRQSFLLLDADCIV